MPNGPMAYGSETEWEQRAVYNIVICREKAGPVLWFWGQDHLKIPTLITAWSLHFTTSIIDF
jgi:hypothetical protein